jgi:hypothetical protein
MFYEVMQRKMDEFRKEVLENADKHGQRLFNAAGFLEISQRNDAETRSGLDASLGSMVTGAWTAFEILAGDLWEQAINAHPTGLAALAGKPPKDMPGPPRLSRALFPSKRRNRNRNRLTSSDKTRLFYMMS